jgi:hypothetical protein
MESLLIKASFDLLPGRARCKYSAGAILLSLLVAGCDATISGGSGYQKEFALSQCTLEPTGQNPYFSLEPGHRLVLEGNGDRLEITVLGETKMIEGVTTRVVEEREWKGGKLYEVARNYYAICTQTKDVYYFGEDVAFYKDDKITGNAGTWLAGRDGAKAGLIMPGAPRIGQRYYQEVAPGVAMDRAEVVSLGEACQSPAGKFQNCLKTRERASLDFWSSLKFWEVEYKVYASGIGLIEDQDLRLTRHGRVAQ